MTSGPDFRAHSDSELVSSKLTLISELVLMMSLIVYSGGRHLDKRADYDAPIFWQGMLGLV